MTQHRRTWLITNAMSGSNDDEALDALKQSCGRGGMEIVYHTIFPDEDLPATAELDAQGIGLVTIFAGDGTLNAALAHLSGWSGQVLVLAGGTMNLLFHRLFGEMESEDVVAAVCSGSAQPIRPKILRCDAGDVYAGLLAGPGTAWNRVREAMREADVFDLASGAIDAIGETLGGLGVACEEPAFGRREGYPLILLNPTGSGIEVQAFHSETAADYVAQTWALLQRDFRQGPHDDLGKADRIVLCSTDGEPFGLLLDGEPADTGAHCAFELVPCEVDLLATEPDD